MSTVKLFDILVFSEPERVEFSRINGSFIELPDFFVVEYSILVFNPRVENVRICKAFSKKLFAQLPDLSAVLSITPNLIPAFETSQVIVFLVQELHYILILKELYRIFFA